MQEEYYMKQAIKEEKKELHNRMKNINIMELL